MRSPEEASGNINTSDNASEFSGEITSRQVYEQRGETTLEGDHAAEVKEMETALESLDKLGVLTPEKKAELENKIAEYKELNRQEQEILNSPDVSPAPSDAAPEADNPRTEAVNETIEKAKKKAGLKKLLAGIVVLVAAGVMAVTGYFGINAIKNNIPQNTTKTEATADIDQSASEDKESIAELSTYRGQFASEDGSTYNDEKGAKVNFGEALKSGAPEAEMKDDIINRMVQPGQLAATYFYMQEKTTNPNFGVEGAKFSNPDELLEAMEKDSDLHQRVYNYVKNTIKNNKLAEDTKTGVFHNFFMDSQFETGNIDTSNVEVVGCTTNEDGTKVYSLMNTWEDKDGQIHVDIFTFKEACGGQPIDQIDFTSTVRQIPSPENPNPENPNPDKPNPDKPAPKDQAAADRNSGAADGIVVPEGQNRSVTPEPKANPEKPYDSNTNTYQNTKEDTETIGYNVTVGTTDTTSTKETAPATTTTTTTETTPQMVPGTVQGADTPNDFVAGGTVGTGEVTGDTASADGSGNTIEQNLDTATGVGDTDYSEGF